MLAMCGGTLQNTFDCRYALLDRSVSPPVENSGAPGDAKEARPRPKCYLGWGCEPGESRAA